MFRESSQSGPEAFRVNLGMSVVSPSTRRSATALGIAFVIWAFVWDNARQALGGVLNPTFVLPIPRGLKAVETFAVLCFFVVVLVSPRRHPRQWVVGSTLLVMALLITLVSATLSVAAGYSTYTAALYTSYAYFAPLFLASIVAGFCCSSDDPSAILAVFETLLIINALIAWYQFGIEHQWGDAVHGAMHDAHMYANVTWLGVLLALARLYYAPQKWKHSAALIVLCAPTAWAAQFEMAELVILAVVLGVLFGIVWVRSRRWRPLAIAVYAGALLGGVSAVRTDAAFLSKVGRLDVVVQNLANLGILKGYAEAPSALVTTTFSALVGTGPGSYGSPNAVQPVLTGAEPSPLVKRFTGESYELNEATRGFLGSFVEESTDVTALLVEFGPLTLLCCFASLVLLVIRPAVRALSNESRSIRVAGLWVIASTAHVVLISFGTAFYGWSASHAAVFPIVVTGALLTQQTSRVTAQATTPVANVL